jgi:hypothetical protein
LLNLIPCKRSDKEYIDIRNRHYVENHGTIGRQCHYKIYIDDRLIGIITGASAAYATKGRDEFFKINKENRVDTIGKIICNTVFRLEDNQVNLGTQILKLWRKQVVLDWYLKYKVIPVGFETFIWGENRFGSMYKADNWIFCGITSGSAKYKPSGHGGFDGKHTRIKTEQKLIYCKEIKKSDMSLLNQYLRNQDGLDITNKNILQGVVK